MNILQPLSLGSAIVACGLLVGETGGVHGGSPASLASGGESAVLATTPLAAACDLNNGGCERGAQCSSATGSPVCLSTHYAWTPGSTEALDTRTGYTWQRAPAPQPLSLQAATEYCHPITLPATWPITWLLPRESELLGIVDPFFSPKIDPVAFPDTPADMFWARGDIGRGSVGRVVNFSDGMSFVESASAYHEVRCVRGVRP